jgi:hypothetical protein
MAASFDSFSSSGTNASATQIQCTVPVGGDNRIAFLLGSTNGGTLLAPSGTVNGIRMSILYVGTEYVMFYLVNPPTGSQVFSFTQTRGSRDLMVLGFTYQGVNQFTPFDFILTGATTNVTSHIATGTSDTDETYLSLAFVRDTASALSLVPAVAGVTQRATSNFYNGRVWFAVGDKPGEAIPVMGWMYTGSNRDYWYYVMLGLNPPASAPVSSYGVQFRSYILGLG